jgi:hypothetical protein
VCDRDALSAASIVHHFPKSVAFRALPSIRAAKISLPCEPYEPRTFEARTMLILQGSLYFNSQLFSVLI